MKRIYPLFSTAILIASVSAIAATDVDSTNSVDQISKDANYIFRGKVAKIEHQMSLPHEGQGRGVPYTFVTYDVQQEFKNSAKNNQVTLKFIGGPINETEFVRGSGIPLMDVGDSDILFVSGNTDSPCPLVGCAKGRFREIGGVIFDEQGRSIVMNKDGGITRGQAVKLDEVINNKMSDTIHLTVEEVSSQELAESVDKLDAIAESEGFRPDPAMFGSLVSDAVQKNSGPEELEKLKPVVSQDPKKPFADVIFDPANVSSAPSLPIEDLLEDDEEGKALAPAGTLKKGSDQGPGGAASKNLSSQRTVGANTQGSGLGNKSLNVETPHSLSIDGLEGRGGFIYWILAVAGAALCAFIYRSNRNA